MPSRSKICFFSQGIKASIANRSMLKKFILRLIREEGKKLESVNYIFCTDAILLEMNRKYLNHDFYTDIITFDLSEKRGIRAEIYISVERVRENAHKLGVTFKSEIHRVIFHGLLHLCGYCDKTKEEKNEIRIRENHYLKKYNLEL